MECLTREAVHSSYVATTETSISPTSSAATVSTQTTVPQTAEPTRLSSATLASASNCAPNIVTIPVPIVNQEDIYTYVSVKGSLHDQFCTLFGLNEAEALALSKRFENATTHTVNGVTINAAPMTVINALSQLNYKVICSTGEADIVWTLQREV